MRSVVIGILAMVVLLLAVGESRCVGADRPNILFIFLDDFGWRDTGWLD